MTILNFKAALLKILAGSLLCLLLCSSCDELANVPLRPGDCGLQLTLRFGTSEKPNASWKGRLQVIGAKVSLLHALELEAEDKVPVTPSAGDGTQLDWHFTTPSTSDRDALVVRIIPLDFDDLGSIEIQIHDEIAKQSLEYPFQQLKNGLQDLNPIDRKGWRHLLEIESRYVAEVCS